MLSTWDLNEEHNTITEIGRNLLKLLFDVVDDVGLAPDADFVRRLVLVRAGTLSGGRSFDSEDADSQANEVCLLPCVDWSTAAGYQFTEFLPTSTDNGTMELLLDLDSHHNFLTYFLGYSKDRSFGGRNIFLGTSAGDGCDLTLTLIQVNLSPRVIFDFVDICPASSKYTCNRLSGYRELDDIVGLFLEFDSLVYVRQVIISKLNTRLTSRISDFAPATPFRPPLMRTSSAFKGSRVLPSPPSAASRGNVILTAYLSSRRRTYLPLGPMSEG